MRSRVTILCGFLLFSMMVATPAHAGRWSAFVAWLSDLDPKTFGPGIEMSLFCPAAKDSAVKSGFECAPHDRTANVRHKLVLKSSAAVLLGTLNKDGGTIFVAPVLGIVERESEYFSYGLGVGVIHVGGTLVGGVSQLLVQPRATLRLPKVHLGIRGEVNWLTKGFPAGAFAVNSEKKGGEVAWGVAVVYLR